jgi:hypothetical protein
LWEETIIFLDGNNLAIILAEPVPACLYWIIVKKMHKAKTEIVFSLPKVFFGTTGMRP